MSCSHLEHVQTDNVHLETIQLNDLLHGVIDFREGNFYQIINLANGKIVKIRFTLSVGDNWYVA